MFSVAIVVAAGLFFRVVASFLVVIIVLLPLGDMLVTLALHLLLHFNLLNLEVSCFQDSDSGFFGCSGSLSNCPKGASGSFEMRKGVSLGLAGSLHAHGDRSGTRADVCCAAKNSIVASEQEGDCLHFETL